MRFFPFLFLIIALAAGCKKNVIEPANLKQEYFPMEKGKSVIYEVDSIKFSPLFTNGKDSSHWEVREVMASTFTDNLGREVMRVERYMRKNENDTWIADKVFFAVKEDKHIEWQENNLRFIKLIFPPVEDKEWNGNSLVNTIDTFEYYKDWIYTFTEVDVPFSINGLNFDSTLTVLEVNDENLLEKRYSEAKYAKGVGLIYKEQYNLRIVDSSIPSPSIPWEDKANRGYILRMRIKSL